MAEILVLGAGMVGVSTALALQARGHAVQLLDRGAPGRETSFGNAGVIQTEAAEPYAMPRDPRVILAMMTGRSNDLTWSLRGLAGMAPALWSYFRNSAPTRHAALSQTYARLTSRAAQDHQPLIEAAGCDNLIARDGMAQIYRDPRAFERDATDAERIAARYGPRFCTFDGASYRREDPALQAEPAGVLLWSDTWSCSSPGGLVAAYAALFERRGGRILGGDAESLAQDGSGWTVATADGPLAAQHVVIALGPWAPRLLRRFDYRIPMVLKRGYHGHFQTNQTPRRPIVDMDNGVVASPMQTGLRIATGAALVAHDAPADLRQLERGRRALGDMLQIGPRITEPQWSGTRPCMPDMLPMVGAAPRHPGMWFHFGHGHQGFTLGPTTAEVLATSLEDGEDELTRALSPARRI
ncbi:amino acid dehydrogenase [Salipiger sp. CCB-MM3]|uniref:NAD(P)/FAD-dependent oxidoreductase n=1 Tax=Salipiger sp. CCB-MM3 TaxID=1792508 RepID=UPI00080AA90E|nr:FAD-dependent oxidoreductase [Salipiger sp. CCB-MM3]ANT62575.1 amino acid dehydrogenase [Salipiger sp. CCB-MM3]